MESINSGAKKYLPHFRSVFLPTMLAIEKTGYGIQHSEDFKREAVRIAIYSGLIRRHVAFL